MNVSSLPIWTDCPFVIPDGITARKGKVQALGELVSLTTGKFHCDVGVEHIVGQETIDTMVHMLKTVQFHAKHPGVLLQFIEDETNYVLGVNGPPGREDFLGCYLGMKDDLASIGLGLKTLTVDLQ